LHDATEAANRVEYPEVRKSKAHDDCRLLFEGALLILSYVFEVAGRDYNVEFFDNFDQLAEKYTRIKKYGDEISYTKERFPMTDKSFDSLERVKLLHFANVLKVALHLIPNIKKGHRTHVIQLCARIAEGPGVKVSRTTLKRDQCFYIYALFFILLIYRSISTHIQPFHPLSTTYFLKKTFSVE
jgi:hypothetical protein